MNKNCCFAGKNDDDDDDDDNDPFGDDANDPEKS